MLERTSDQIDALEKRHVMRRLFIWVEARDPDTGAPAPGGVWDDVGSVEYMGRTYHGSGNLVQVSALSATGDLTIPAVTVSLSGVAAEAVALVRGRMLDQAPIQISIGIFDVETRDIIPPLLPYFSGFVDNVQVTTPEAGGAATIVLTCESTSRALTAARTATRSDASCRARAPTDAFYEYTGVQREKPLYFGREAPAA